MFAEAMATTSFDQHASQWNAVTSRDARFDDAFVYAVVTTGVFCRPTCPSRRPRRENVRFYHSIEDAQRAGFRACRRCRPTEPRREGDARVELVRELIDADPERTPTLAELAEAASLSPFHLQRVFRKHVGVSPAQYARSRRLERFKKSLRAGGRVTDATYESGYGSSSRAYEASSRLGMTPRSYQRGGRGETIDYAIVRRAPGHILVAATPRGLCAVRLGDSAVELERALATEYPEAHRRRVAAATFEWARHVEACLEGTSPERGWSLDVAGTPFQWKVWNALQRIPFGSTATYSSVARAIGQPTAARAVARACATNPLALVVPCHRVVAANGSTGGYRWGAARKAKLLALEQGS